MSTDGPVPTAPVPPVVDADRQAIEARRHRLIRLALASLGAAAVAGLTATSCACLEPTPCLRAQYDAGTDGGDQDAGVPDTGPQACLSPIEDSGPATDAATDAGPATDASPDAAG